MGSRVVAGAGPAHGLILRCDHRSALDDAGAGEEPRCQAGVEARGVQVLEDSADRRLRQKGPPLFQAQSLKISGGQVGGVLPYRRQAPASREHPRHDQGQDRGQVMAHAPPMARVGHVLENLSQGLARQDIRGGG